MSETLRIALIDDDTAVLDSTRLVLQVERIEAETFSTAAAFLARQKGPPLHCVVSDVRMPGMSGLELLAELRRRGSTLPLILITGHGDVPMAVAALKGGAADFFEKPFAADALAAAIRRAAADVRDTMKAQEQRGETLRRIAHLTARQREVMMLVVEGYANKQIAARLGISVRTVETYRLWVMERMEAGSLAALVRMVMEIPTAELARITAAPDTPGRPEPTDKK